MSCPYRFEVPVSGVSRVDTISRPEFFSLSLRSPTVVGTSLGYSRSTSADTHADGQGGVRFYLRVFVVKTTIFDSHLKVRVRRGASTRESPSGTNPDERWQVVTREDNLSRRRGRTERHSGTRLIVSGPTLQWVPGPDRGRYRPFLGKGCRRF